MSLCNAYCSEIPGYCPHNLPPAIRDIRMRAEQGSVLDQILWGKTLLKSDYCPPCREAAVYWFARAAKSFYGPAHNMLGRCAQFGWGVPLSLENSVVHYKNAALLGDAWGRYNLAIAKMRGLGCAIDRREAFKLLHENLPQKHAKSLNVLGRFYEEGWECDSNPEYAAELYAQSAHLGDYRGQYNYGHYWATRRNFAQALYWWRACLNDATDDIRRALSISLSKIPPLNHPLYDEIIGILNAKKSA